MCGILGVTHCQSGREALSLLKHRGPDSLGEFQNDDIYLGHTRLSILDLSDCGKQPMISENGDAVIIFNGEISTFNIYLKRTFAF